MNLKVEDYYPSEKRFLLRFKEKGNEEKELPVHHKLEELLDQYLKASGLEKEPQSSLFPASRKNRQIIAATAGGILGPLFSALLLPLSAKCHLRCQRARFPSDVSGASAVEASKGAVKPSTGELL